MLSDGQEGYAVEHEVRSAPAIRGIRQSGADAEAKQANEAMDQVAVLSPSRFASA